VNRSDTFWSIAECVIIDTLGIGLVTKGGDPVSTAAPTQPSLWAINRFGAGVAGELWWRVPTALAAAVSRAMDTYEASQMNTYHAFGSARWPLQYEELVNHLQAVPTAVPLRPPGAFYQLIIVGGHVLLPWYFAKTPGVDMRDVRPGRSFGLLARSVVTDFGPAPRWHQAPLPLMPADEEDERDVAQISQILGQVDPRPKTLIVGYACNAHQGLLRVCWGDAALAAGGEFHWYHHEELPLPAGRVPARPHSDDQ